MLPEHLPPTLEIQLENCFELFGLSILFYDYMITFGDEVEYIWMRLEPKARTLWLFFPNRYFFLLANTAMTALPFTSALTSQGCTQLQLTRQIALVINQGLVCLLLSLRVYALYGRSWRIAVSLLLSAALLGAVALASQLFDRHDLPPDAVQYDCSVPVSRTSAIRLAVAWEALFVYDAILFGLTLFKTLQTRRRYGNIPIPAMVLRYGVIYFAVIALANAANITMYWFAGPFLRGGLSLFAGSFSTVITSRFMLELYGANSSGSAGSARTEAQPPSTCMWTSPEVELDTIWTVEFNPGSQPPLSTTRFRGARTLCGRP